MDTAITRTFDKSLTEKSRKIGDLIEKYSSANVSTNLINLRDI